MHEILRELNSTPGVRGSAVVMNDGVVVAADLSAGADPERFSALLSSLFSQFGLHAPKLGLGTVKRAVVTASRGRFALIDIGGVFLVAELGRDIDPGAIELEIESAAAHLRKRLRLHSDTEPAPAPTALPAQR